MDARLAGAGRRAADRADRRSAPPRRRGRHLPPFRGAGARHPRAAPAAPDRARPRRDRRRAERSSPPRSPTISTSCARARASWRSSRTSSTAVATSSRRRAGPRSSTGDADVEDEDLIQREDMVVTVTHAGYIKRVPLSTYRAQRRGGKGRSGMATRDEDFVTRLFVANTHTPVLFFSSLGQVYKEKVWRLPLAAPQARGKALINMLPLEAGERITTIMPLPEDEADWDTLDVMFATSSGHGPAQQAVRLRRREPRRQDRHEARRGRPHRRRRRSAREDDDVLLTTAQRPVHPLPGAGCARLQGPRTRPACAASTSAEGDTVISMAILRHVEATPEERAAYLKMRRAHAARASRRGGERRDGAETPRRKPATGEARCSQERYAEMSAAEQFILTISRERLRQAHLVLRVPDHRPRRQRHRRHGGQRPERQARRLLPGRADATRSCWSRTPAS